MGIAFDLWTGVQPVSVTMPDLAEQAPYLACKRRPVKKLGKLIPDRFLEALEHNQRIASCCRHPENHEISAWYSSEADRARGVPDIYIFHCSCGRDHRRFCIGGTDREQPESLRPFWDVR